MTLEELANWMEDCEGGIWYVDCVASIDNNTESDEKGFATDRAKLRAAAAALREIDSWRAAYRKAVDDPGNRYDELRWDAFNPPSRDQADTALAEIAR